ncbi:major facilitator superfamily domain-containing protein [Suillus paluster]|uniref:major facilitator superfamily domain-containing protein n=1 Tax=Suillus paluster TaxID=48578 RepID=UPI001B872DAC|nr:major facilitator superfamily domain-containing protein [Suillus paluster]KAG1731216.1 major facilitator superfamily domain-containing protein [Suillus paluster]
MYSSAPGTLLCGFSTNMEMLVAARFLSGMGGGGIQTTSSIATSDMYSIRSRGLAQGVESLFNGLGMGLGGPIGGLISDRFGWRWAFLIQVPFFALSLALTTYNLRYVTPGDSKSTKEVLKRIDYGGIFTLLLSVGSCLVFLSMKYNEDLPWSNQWVYVPLALAGIFFVVFILVELLVAPEPMMAPSLLKQKVPILIGASNVLVSSCSLSVMYFFPMIITPYQIPVGFGNAVILQTNLVALLAHLPESSMAVGTGFIQLFRGLGQVAGVAISSALFQFKLDHELRSRIHGDGAAEIVSKIRHSTTFMGKLPPDLQRVARDSYAISLRAVFALATCCALLAYIIRLPIPEKKLDRRPGGTDKSTSPDSPANGHAVDSDEEDNDTLRFPSQRGRRFRIPESTEVVIFRPGLARKPRLRPGFRRLGLAKIPGRAKAASDGWLWLGFGLSRGPSTENGEKHSEDNFHHGVSI